MDPGLAIQKFLEYVVSALVAHPEEVSVERQDRAGGPIFRISLQADDASRVIGRGGKTIQAIQSLVQASAEKHGIHVEIEVRREPRE